MSNNSLEIVHEGWLTKSPPSKPILRARWRRRWFVLRHSGELPGQYFLEYYTDKDCRKLKGKIDLDQCEQVDAGLQFEHRKQKYQHMFDVKTPKRTYFLAAESEEEMNKWVTCVCQVCRLIACKEEDDVEYGTEEEVGTASDALTLPNRVDATIEETESPPVSPSSTVSGPYIPISECISGEALLGPCALEHLNSLMRHGGYDKLTASVQYASANASRWRNKTPRRASQSGVPCASLSSTMQTLPSLLAKMASTRTGEELRSDEFYDSPRQLHPPNVGQGNGTPPISPTADGESVFTDDEWNAPVMPVPSVNWETFPNAGGERKSSCEDANEDIGSWSVVQKFGRLTVVDSKNVVPANIIGRRNQTLPHKPAPPRPPKPYRRLILDAPSHNYLNLENVAARPVKFKQSVKESSATETVPPSPKDSVTSKQSTDSRPRTPPCVEVVGRLCTDDTYDFPRSHQQPVTEKDAYSKQNMHCYSNAAPTQINGVVFRYDFHDDKIPLARDDATTDATEEPTSPRSEGSSSLASSTTAAIYSNLPSPQVVGEGGSGGIPTPPAVDRGLKPGRKLSDSTSAISGSELSPGPITPGHVPPDVDRKLKPHRKYLDTQLEPGCPLQLAPPPDGTRSLRRNRAAPSPTPPGSNHVLRNGQRNSSSDDDHRHFPFDDEAHSMQWYGQESQMKRSSEIQYLDLDLESDVYGSTSLGATHTPKSPERAAPSATVYKTVDFLKTQAFNMTRQKVEEERKQCPAS